MGKWGLTMRVGDYRFQPHVQTKAFDVDNFVAIIDTIVLVEDYSSNVGIDKGRKANEALTLIRQEFSDKAYSDWLSVCGENMRRGLRVNFDKTTGAKGIQEYISWLENKVITAIMDFVMEE